MTQGWQVTKPGTLLTSLDMGRMGRHVLPAQLGPCHVGKWPGLHLRAGTGAAQGAQEWASRLLKGSNVIHRADRIPKAQGQGGRAKVETGEASLELTLDCKLLFLTPCAWYREGAN